MGMQNMRYPVSTNQWLKKHLERTFSICETSYKIDLKKVWGREDRNHDFEFWNKGTRQCDPMVRPHPLDVIQYA